MSLFFRGVKTSESARRKERKTRAKERMGTESVYSKEKKEGKLCRFLFFFSSSSSSSPCRLSFPIQVFFLLFLSSLLYERRILELSDRHTKKKKKKKIEETTKKKEDNLVERLLEHSNPILSKYIYMYYT